MRLTLIALLLAGFAGCDATPEEPVSEFDVTLKAAEQGDANAQFLLGYMYEVGDGVPEDDTEAVKWFRKAAEQGHDAAQYNLARMYASGDGTQKNDTEAVKWCRKAGEQGLAIAQLNLGFIYSNGEGIPEDYVEAYAWWSIAATNAINGSKDAKERLEQLKAEFTPDQLVAAEKRIEELTEQINANKAK